MLNKTECFPEVLSNISHMLCIIVFLHLLKPWWMDSWKCNDLNNTCTYFPLILVKLKKTECFSKELLNIHICYQLLYILHYLICCCWNQDVVYEWLQVCNKLSYSFFRKTNLWISLFRGRTFFILYWTCLLVIFCVHCMNYSTKFHDLKEATSDNFCMTPSVSLYSIRF